MNESIIAVRYSRALFQSAIEKSILDEVNDDMLLILEVCKIPEAAEIIASPVIVPSRKISALKAVLSGKVQDITIALVELVVNNGRESLLPSIARVFNHETMKYKGITASVLTTAVKVDEKVRKEIISLVSKEFGTKIEMKENVDPGIIGGFILRVDDKYIDASVKSKLRKIRKELKGSITAS
jgi:F-type H+-transporting ATPase subunit delta